MDPISIIGLTSIIVSGLTLAIGSVLPAKAQGDAVSQALRSIAQQPDASNTITRTLFVGLAMIESFAIYCFVVAMILIFFNPFWNYLTQSGG
ncbi:MAG: F0F1 ATP synthase subunit C [Anaerolineae bacterium]|nr:F0F1 ATP synthase subunit C [Anaerolineae bacterium]